MSISETTELAPAFSPLLRRYTLEEFRRLSHPEGSAHYGYLVRTLFIVPPPDPPDRDVDSRLNKSLVAFLAANGIAGNVYHPREAIYEGDAYIEPDMMYVSDALAAEMGKRRTSADIVFEILSRT